MYANASCGGIGQGIGRMYRVPGNGQVLTACTCDSPAESWDARLEVFCDISCPIMSCLTGSSNFNCGSAGGSSCLSPIAGSGLHETVTWCSSAGQLYWVFVSSASMPPPGEGNFILKITAGNPCSVLNVCRPPNDECVNAKVVVNGTNSGLTNFGATEDPATPGGSCVSVGDFRRDVWYRYTATANGPTLFTLCGGTPYDSIMAVYAGSCSGLAELGCDDDGCGSAGGLSTTTRSLVAGTHYFIRIGSWGNSATGTFALTISPSASSPD
jgi:hypothetical protein